MIRVRSWEAILAIQSAGHRDGVVHDIVRVEALVNMVIMMIIRGVYMFGLSL